MTTQDFYPETPIVVTDSIKALIESIVNAFETGSKGGDYSNVSVYHDGPNKCLQVTYGRSQTTEYGHLPALFTDFIARWKISNLEIPPWLQTIIDTKLQVSWTDRDDELKAFTSALKEAGKEPLMKNCQNALFENEYWIPAEKWFNDNRFTLNLSMLVIYDSFIHSGGILQFLRSRFVDFPPVKGGDEKKWIQHYCEVRKEWLEDNVSSLLQNTAYRAGTFLDLINSDNWNLDKFPISIPKQDVTYRSLLDLA